MDKALLTDRYYNTPAIWTERGDLVVGVGNGRLYLWTDVIVAVEKKAKENEAEDSTPKYGTLESVMTADCGAPLAPSTCTQRDSQR